MCPLTAPDFLGEGSLFALDRSHLEVVIRALHLKQLAGDLCQVIGGRHTYSITPAVVGMTHQPETYELEALRGLATAAQIGARLAISASARYTW